MKKVTRRIPDSLYQKIHASIPVPCVDTVVDDGHGNFLLVKRKNKPEKGAWWFPGGRVLRGERLQETALRKLKQETGLKGRVIRLLGVYDYFSKVGYFPGIPAHTIAIVYHAKVNPTRKVVIDWQSSDSKWCRKISPRWRPYVKKFLKEAGFK